MSSNRPAALKVPAGHGFSAPDRLFPHQWFMHPRPQMRRIPRRAREHSSGSVS
jgi:hypothetical protein